MRTIPFAKDDISAALRLLTHHNELVLKVMFSTGLRVGDVLSLKTEDIKKSSVTIKEQKTGKKKRVRISSQLREEMMKISGRVYVFEHRNDRMRPRTRQAVWKDLKRASEMLRISKGLGTHSARKTWAIEKLKSGYSLEEIQKMMNHTTPEITMIYCLADKINTKKCNSKK